MDDKDKKIEGLETEIVGLKVRLRRIEDFILSFPSGEDFVNEFDYQEEPDDLFGQAVKTVLQYNRASASLLQRQLSIGYARAARLLDQLVQKGFVSPSDGTSKPRDVFPEKIKEYLEANPTTETLKVEQMEDVDELFEQAAEVVLEYHASPALIQRKLKVGYARAARIIDQLAKQGLISESEGYSKPREVHQDKIDEFFRLYKLN